MKLKKSHWLLWSVLLFLPFLGGCSPSDDVQKIFTSHNWKLTYISQDKAGHWYKFPDVSDSNYDAYDPKKGTKNFTLKFEGSTSDHIITGTFTGSGSVTANGTWSANGKNNKFGTNPKSIKVTDSSDKLGQKIEYALKNADQYVGDTEFLYLYFTYEKERLYLAFTPVR